MYVLRLLQKRGARRVGVLGGMFDPPHFGHLMAANEVLNGFSLDAVIFMPSGMPPHKAPPEAPAELRYAMTLAATADHHRFFVSRYELDNDSRFDFTVDTMSFLAELFGPLTELYFITGADAAVEMSTWKEPKHLLSLCRVVAVTRPGVDLTRLEAVAAELGVGQDRIVPYEIPSLGISSTLIRSRVARGAPIKYLVPSAVESLIVKWGLYRRDPV